MDFTIVTPSFRQLQWLELCIASIADQEGVTLEHIVQDAGTDGFDEFSRQMAEKWPDREGYRRLMISELDQGMYDAVNRGLKKGKGSLCAYLNCDEQYLPGALGKVLDMFKKKASSQLLFGGVLIVKPSGELISARQPARLFLPHLATCHLPNFTCAMFFRRTLLEAQAAWFDSHLRDCADALWVMDRLRNTTSIILSMDFTTAFTDTGANMNLSPNAIREAREIRQSAPLIWRWLKPLLLLRHWLGKLLDGAYWPKPIAYSIYTESFPARRKKFFEKHASPFWVQRWFIRARLRWLGMKKA